MKELIEEVKELNESNDIFGTYSKAKAIREFIELNDNEQLLEKNNMIAIYGEWGIGKSCLMQTIYKELDTSKFETIWFDTWKYEKDENLAYSLFKFIGKDRFWNKLLTAKENILDNTYGIFKSLAKGVEINLGILNFKPGDALDEAENKDEQINEKEENKKCLWEKINEFEEMFKNINFSNKKIVVFLDDLDRCESENIVTLLSTIKLLLSINKNIIFIIGIDKKAVTLALQNKYNNDYNKADEYLEKIFPITFQISNSIHSQNFKQYISDITDLDIEDVSMVIEFFCKIQFNNSRHIKKVLRKYYLIKNYIASKDMDIKNKYIVILILYSIILNIFYNDEYKEMLKENKEKNYKNILLINYDKNGFRKEGKFDNYEKICNIKYTNNSSYEIYKILVRFSSYKLYKLDLNAMKTMDGQAFIEYYNWIGLFENNICNDFLEFLLTDSDVIGNFAENGKVNEAVIYNYLKIIDGIL